MPRDWSGWRRPSLSAKVRPWSCPPWWCSQQQSASKQRRTESEHAQPLMRLRATGLCLILRETKMVRCHGFFFFTADLTVRFIICTHTTVELDPTLDFVAGTVAGVSGLVVGFPFDTGESHAPPVRSRKKLVWLSVPTSPSEVPLPEPRSERTIPLNLPCAHDHHA